MRLGLIHLTLFMAMATSAMAGPAEKAFSLRWQFGGASSDDDRVVMDAFRIRETLERVQRPDREREAIAPQRDERADIEDRELRELRALDPNLIPTAEQMDLMARMNDRKLKQVSHDQLLGRSGNIRPNGSVPGPSVNFTVTGTDR
ncbi:MAG: hypothetical protein V4760_17270 [Bdellovibrionota bacterium]